MDAADLEGAALDAAVAKAYGHNLIEVDQIGRREVCQVVLPTEDDGVWTDYSPSTEWAYGGPLIERERIDISACKPDGWAAFHPRSDVQYGPTPLIAAMRAYVASKGA